MPPPGVDAAIARLAERQHGVVGRAQLRELGLSGTAIDKRVAAKRLLRIHRSVYAPGHAPLTTTGRYLAAVLASGPEALLSHRSAAALWDLRDDRRRTVDVTAPGRPGRRQRGIEIHRSRTLLRPDDVVALYGIPCSTLARTLVDMAEVAGEDTLARLVAQAEFQRLLILDEVMAALGRAHGRHGAPKLRRVLTRLDPDPPGLTRSDLEERFLALCDGAGIPRPRVNVSMTLGGEEMQVDFLWDRARLIAETDGHAAHGTRQAFERDRRRDQVLQLAGFRVARFTWRQVRDTPAEVTQVIRGLLPAR